MTRSIFLPVLRCRAKWCSAAFVGTGDYCPRCTTRAAKAREIATGKRASRRDIAEHKRATIRKRLGVK